MSLTVQHLLDAFTNIPSHFVASVRKNVKTLPIDQFGQQFWTLWKANKDGLKSAGFSVSQFRNEWQISLWENTNPTPVPVMPTIIPESNIVLDQQIISKSLDYQIPTIKQLVNILSHASCCLDASEMGLGKTYTTVAIALQLHLKVFVICPRNAIGTWNKVFRHFEFPKADILGVVNYELIKNGKYLVWVPAKRGNRIIEKKITCPYLTVESNPDRSKYAAKYINSWNLPANTLIVFDEAHKTKNFHTQNAQLLFTLARYVSTQKIALLSGTIADDPMKMMATGLSLKLFTEPELFYNWASMFGCRKVHITRDVDAWKFVGTNADLQRLHHQIFPDHGVRMKKSDIPSFPENQIIGESININSDAETLQKEYDDAEIALREWANSTAAERNERAARGLNPMAIRTHLRMSSEALKAPHVAEWVKDLIDEGFSVAIFCNYTETLYALAEALKTDCVFHGGNRDVRDRFVEQFQSDQSNVIILNIQAGGVSISLHDLNGNRPRIAIIFPTYNAQDLVQATGRIHRAGSKSKATQYIVFAAGTIEESVCEKCQDKLKHIAILNDGDIESSDIFYHKPGDV